MIISTINIINYYGKIMKLPTPIAKSSLISLLLVFVYGCANSFIQTYPGKLLPLSETGTVTCESSIQVVSVDGNSAYRLYSGGGLYYSDCIISLKPGKHTITYKYYFSTSTMITQTRPLTHKINVEKGAIYRIKYKMEGGLWKPWIEKLKGKELEKQLKDVKIRIKNRDV